MAVAAAIWSNGDVQVNKYIVRRTVALVVLATFLFGVFALGRATFGGGDDAPATAKGATSAAALQPTDKATKKARATVPILCYHQVREFTASDTAEDRAYGITPAHLEEHLVALKEAGYTTITSEQYVAALEKGTALPAKPIILTFDDGSIGHYTEAFRLLQQHGMTATFYPMTVVLNKDQWITDDQIREMDAAGMTFGVHSWDHQQVPNLTTDADFRAQVVEPKKKLEEILGHPVTTFAYPFGLWTPRAFSHLRAAGYTAAFQLNQKPVNSSAPMLTLRRVAVGDVSAADMMTLINQNFPPAADAAGTATTAAAP